MRNQFIKLAFCLLSALPSRAQTDTTGVTGLLSLSLEDLMDVQVVTATGYLQTTGEAPATITVISSHQIRERGYEQLEDALRDIPGIDMIHLNGYAPTFIYFRGMYGAENLRALLMIDGIPENNIVGNNDMAGPAYSLHNVERIEIIWGPASALYGANAFGGVINIITKKGADMNGIYAEKGFGTFNTSFERVTLGLKRSKFEFNVAGSLYSSDGPKFKNRDPQYSASYVDKAFSINGSISYYAKRSKTTLGYRSYNTPMGWGTFFNSATKFLHLPSQGYGNSGILGLMARDIRGEKSGLNHVFLRTLFLQNEWKANDKFSLLSRLVYRETGTADDSYAYITLDGRKLYRVITASYSNRVSGEISANYTISEKQRLSVGIEYSQENLEEGSRKTTIDTSIVYLIDGRDSVTNLNSTFLPRIYDIRNNFGSYAQYILKTKLLRKTTFTFGIRYDYNSYFKNNVSPRLVIVNQPDDKWVFKAQFGTAFRAPTNTEVYQAPPNIVLKTEKIKTYEVNAVYSASKNTRLQLNVFRNELKDVIVISNLSGLTTNKNPAVITIDGIEGVVNAFITKNITGFLNFTYQDARGKNTVTGVKGDVAGVANIKGNIGATILVEDLFTVSLTGNAIGQRRVPRTDPYGPVDGYFLLNCVIGADNLFYKGVSASISVRNALNSKWLDPGFRTADGFIYSTVLEQPGINGVFKIGISL